MCVVPFLPGAPGQSCQSKRIKPFLPVKGQSGQRQVVVLRRRDPFQYDSPGNLVAEALAGDDGLAGGRMSMHVEQGRAKLQRTISSATRLFEWKSSVRRG